MIKNSDSGKSLGGFRMKKKVIALADNSYTIRRIVELSFSEIENIEVHSFENGSGLKEKLLQLEPDVVIVDIKLPEISGYDICRFINETPLLSRSRVFLMKGSFEAVDNEMIKNLKYEDIVTKPFDSNALVNSVMKIFNQEEQRITGGFADEEPSSFPEDIIEIEPDSSGTEGISFSDIHLDLEAPAPVGNTVPQNQVLERDEILPSEEITQGTQPSKDTLLAPENEETIQNPFNEEPLAEDVKLLPEELIAPMVPKSENGPVVQNPPAESEDLKFTIDREDEIFAAEEKIVGDTLTKIDADAPAETMFSEKDEIFDFDSANQKQDKDKDSEVLLEKIFDEELFVQKIRPEVISPEAELEKLSQTPQKETKIEPQVEYGLSLQEKMDLTGKMEDKLTLTIKELLWEIVPSLAEKIIKEEIDKIKSEASDTGF